MSGKHKFFILSLGIKRQLNVLQKSLQINIYVDLFFYVSIKNILSIQIFLYNFAEKVKL